MKKETTLHFTEKPSIISCYFKFLFSRKKGLRPGESLPVITATWNNVKVDRNNLNAYAATCGLAVSGHLPPLYPHIISAPIHTTMLSHKDFPLPMMGSIHHRNHIIQHRQIHTDETLDIFCNVETKRNISKGLEFDIMTNVTVSGEPVWDSITTVFIRGKFGEPDKPSELSNISSSPEAKLKAEWFVPAGTGRKYAKITGDYNPIHMSPLSAKLFGFKRDIAHGMWTLANAIGRMPLTLNNKPVKIDAAFKGPMFMNNKAKLNVFEYDTGNKLDVYCGDNPRPIICADIKFVEPGTKF